MSRTTYILRLDSETVELIEDYKLFKGDESYSNRLADKILQLYESRESKHE